MVGNIEKVEMLENEGFFYHPIRMIYINRSRKKIFSYEAVEDKDSDWIRDKIAEGSDPTDWQFYFNEDPSIELREDLIAEIDNDS